MGRLQKSVMDDYSHTGLAEAFRTHDRAALLLFAFLAGGFFGSMALCMHASQRPTQP
ncbi:hypothetical protein [Andreprevotia sp. IGB-42]|uniref:hypothetical protein n=1 Tax=Andreprevotia sp. IGB-42 TaxID=2497473 RepID=UPI001357BB58|nr:hypothetical protein [Andreprevotia sp. IGB-42]